MPRLEADIDEVVSVPQRAAQTANLRHVLAVTVTQPNPNRPPAIVVEWVPMTEGGKLVHTNANQEDTVKTLRVRNASRVAGVEAAIDTFLATVVPLIAAHKKANPLDEGDV